MKEFFNKYGHYIAAPVFYAAVAISGGLFTKMGLYTWYPLLVKPSFTPPGNFIGTVWTVIYILTALSMIIFVNKARDNELFGPIIGLYVANGIFNAAWGLIFFGANLLGLAVIDAGFILFTVGMLMVLVGRYSFLACLLLLPYFVWTCFAAYLSYVIYQLN